MPDAPHGNPSYFVFGFPLSGAAWQRYAVRDVLPSQIPTDPGLLSLEIRDFAKNINESSWRQASGEATVPAEVLLALRTLNQALRHVVRNYFQVENPDCLDRCQAWATEHLGADNTTQLWQTFCELFPPVAVAVEQMAPAEYLAADRDRTLLEMLLLFVNVTNPAAAPATTLFDDTELRQRSSFTAFVTGLEGYLDTNEPAGSEGQTIFHLLRAPSLASPDSLAGQLAYIREHWSHLLPEEMLRSLLFAMDVLKEVDLARSAEYGPPPVLEFGPGSDAWDADEPEPEAFSRDADWMSNVVLMAKSVYVWLDQIGRSTGRTVTRLDQIPDAELDRLAKWGVTGLWLIGLWQRADASRKIKQQMGNPEAAASAYALYAYRIADDLGGEEAWQNLSARAGQRGIRLASDMVPNHMGLDSQWVVEHPEYFLQLEHSPYPAYSFNGDDLCEDHDVSIRIEDGYRDHSDAAVVFQRVDHRSGDVRYIYHGNDGTSMPWNDTAQLNFLLPEVREAVTQVILDVARRFPIIRFDAAMTLAKKHYQRLWFPAPGDAGAIPSRAEHGLDKPAFNQVFPTEFWRDVVDRVAAEAPDTLLLAEAFWLMEGYFVRTLGMHRVYNSAFMNMLKMEDNQKYRQTLKNVLEFSPEVLQRFVNFMNNPDERTAVEQFGKGDKYFGCMLLLVTMPGLPMLGHGQIEGYSEKYGMEYRKAYWDEPVDEDLVARHEHEIFPLMRRRHLFSGADNFSLFDFESNGGWVDENVYAYTNRAGDEAALVLFNNCYEQTTGRVRQSSAVNTGSAEQPNLVQRSLGEALGLDAEQGVWYIYRDAIGQQEYLRRGAELAYEGFEIQLDGYGYRVLIDFQRVHESEGRWAEVAGMLQGGGTPSVHQAMRRLDIQRELATVRNWVRPELLSALEWPLTAKKKATPSTVASDDLPVSLTSTMKDLAALQSFKAPKDLGKQSQQDLADVFASLAGSRIPQAVYMQSILQLLPGQWHDGDKPLADIADLSADDLLLVVADLRQELVTWTGHDFAGHSTVDLAEVLAASETGLVAMAKGKVDWFLPILELPCAKRSLGINRHEGHTYLNREALENYLRAMVVCGLLRTDKADPAGLLDSRALILAAAETATYDVRQLRKDLGRA